jgi:hypothetical protein
MIIDLAPVTLFIFIDLRGLSNPYFISITKPLHRRKHNVGVSHFEFTRNAEPISANGKIG